MASGVLTVAVFLALSWAVLQVEGSCREKGQGKLKTNSGEKAYIRLPCKYYLTTTYCQGYKIHVAPEQAYDEKNRLYTKTVWISVSKDGFYWKGRSTHKRLIQYFDEHTVDSPFSTEYENMTGAPFEIIQSGDGTDLTAILSASDADFEIIYRGYDAKDKDLRKANGVEIICPEPEYMDDSHYPYSFCGNTTSPTAVKTRKRDLGLTSKTKTFLYDILNNDEIKQMNQQCVVATEVFGNCQVSKSSVIEACADVLIDRDHPKCLLHYNEDPMDAFVHCLKYQCLNDTDSCNNFKAAVESCLPDSIIPATC